MFYYIKQIISFIAYRTTKRYNIVKIQSLPPNYYDKDTILLHSIMQLIVDYVEIELSAHYEACTNKNKLLSYVPWAIRPQVRNAELGLKYIDEYVNLISSGGENEKNADIELNDAAWNNAYQKIKTVYLWWKNTYPNRKSPEDASGFTAFMKNKSKYSKLYVQKKQKRIFDKIIKIEEEYANEEAEMMKIVIDIRAFLWT